MPQIRSSAKRTLPIAVEKLAEQLAFNGVMRKQAGLGDILSGVGNFVKKRPGMVGSLIGAGLGGIHGAANGDVDEKGKKRRGRGLLSGLLAGAGIGGGVGLLGKGIMNGGLFNGATAEGHPTEPNSGPPVAITPELIEAQRAKENRIWNKHPILSLIGAGDILHQGTGTLAEAVNHGSSNNPKHLYEGLNKLLNPAKDGNRTWLNRLESITTSIPTGAANGVANKSKEITPVLDYLRRLASSTSQNPKLRWLLHRTQGLDVNANLGDIVPALNGMTAGQLREAVHAGSGSIRGGTMQDIVNIISKIRGKAGPLVTPFNALPGPRVAPGLIRSGVNKIWRGVENLPTAGSSLGWKLGPRAALYGIPLALSYLGGKAQANQADNAQLNQLIDYYKNKT